MQLKTKICWKALAAIAILTTVSGGFNSQSHAQLPLHSDKTLAQADPDLQTKTVFYTVTGSTAQQLRNQMNQIGPVEEGTGKRFDGYTKWYVRWNYRYQNQNSRCNITSVRVRTEVTITLPQWKPSRFPAKALSDRWNRYIRALTAHEHQHKNHGIAAHREILQLLQQFPSQPSCPDLETQANAAAHKIIQKYSQKDIEYDRVTRHGAREGTVFP